MSAGLPFVVLLAVIEFGLMLLRISPTVEWGSTIFTRLNFCVSSCKFVNRPYTKKDSSYHEDVPLDSVGYALLSYISLLAETARSNTKRYEI